MKKNNKNGFTLLELIIVSGLSVMLLLTISSVFMTFLIGSTNANLRKQVNAEGNYALSQMSFLLRNSIKIKACNASATSIELTSIDGKDTILNLSNNQVASNSATFLTSEDVLVEDLKFYCNETNLVKTVKVSFEMKHKINNQIEEEFITQVLIRN